MRQWLKTGFLTAAAAFLMTVGSPVWAISTISELSSYLDNSKLSGEDALLFYTKECHVLVLADNEGNIGAVLLHTNNKGDKAEDTVELLSALLSIGEEPEIRYSKDGYSAVMLYESVAELAQNGSDSIVATSRLTTVYNILNTEQKNCTPHRWHNGGISFRSYSDSNNLRYEITPDLTSPIVPYIEIRIAENISPQAVPMLAAHDYGLPSNRQTLRMLSSALGGASPISSNSANDTHLARRKNVYCLGYKRRLHSAYRSREGINHYIFPSFNFPSEEANLSVSSDESIAKSNTEQQNEKRATLTELRKYFGGGREVDAGLHIYNIDDCRVLALAEPDGRLGAFIIEAVKPAERAKATELRKKLLELFPTPLYIHHERSGNCEIIVYHGQQAEKHLINTDRMVALRTMLLNNRRVQRVTPSGDFLKLSYPSKDDDNSHTAYFDLTRPTLNLLTIQSEQISPLSEVEVVSLLRLTNGNDLSSEDTRSLEEALNGKLVYIHKKNKVVTTLGNKTRRYASGTPKEVRKANNQNVRNGDTGSAFASIGDLPAASTLPTTPFTTQQAATEESAEKHNYTPEEARRAYIDYLNKM